MQFHICTNSNCLKLSIKQVLVRVRRGAPKTCTVIHFKCSQAENFRKANRFGQRETLNSSIRVKVSKDEKHRIIYSIAGIILHYSLQLRCNSLNFLVLHTESGELFLPISSWQRYKVSIEVRVQILTATHFSFLYLKPNTYNVLSSPRESGTSSIAV